MRHTPLDHYAKGSAFFPVEPSVKLAGSVAFVSCVAFVLNPLPLLFGMLFVLALLALSGVPAGHFARRYLIALPFIVFPAVSALVLDGAEQFFVFILRISACVLALLLLASTTPFFDLVKALRRMGLPEVFTVMLTFLYRYVFLFQEELERMLRARKARGFGGGRSLLDRRAVEAISATAGMVLVRAHTRGVRVFDAMVGRGYQGEVRTLDRWRVDGGSVTFSATLVAFGVFLLLIDRGWWPGLQ